MLLRQACWWRCCKCCGRCRQLCLVICGLVPSDSNEPLKPILLKPAGQATFTFSQLGISGTLQAQQWKEFTSNERVRTNTPQKTHTDSLSLCQIPQSSKGNQGQMRGERAVANRMPAVLKLLQGAATTLRGVCKLYFYLLSLPKFRWKESLCHSLWWEKKNIGTHEQIWALVVMDSVHGQQGSDVSVNA